MRARKLGDIQFIVNGPRQPADVGALVEMHSGEPDSRLVDDTNEVEMARFHARDMAHCLAGKFRSRGHGQTYSVRRVS